MVDMDSRPIAVEEQKKIEVNMAIPDGRIRRALVDIGNDKAKQITRPVTRGYAKAQAAAASLENNVHEIIEISPDTMEKIKSNKKKSRKRRRSSRNKKRTFTSTLTETSKADCSMNKKKNEEILDVDAGDFENEIAVVEYIEDIYIFYKEMEIEWQVIDYIQYHPEMMTRKMRTILVDWLINVHLKFELTMETLYLTINIMDRYFASRPRTETNELQLVGIGAMLMASKYEEIWAPEVNDFILISDRAYTHNQILKMEKRILESLEWNLTVPTLYVFLVRFIKVSTATAESANAAFMEENMSYFLAEIGMVNYATVLYFPSMIAAASVYAARSTLNVMPVWTETLKFQTGYSEMQLLNCATMLIGFRLSGVNNFKAVCLKYSNPDHANAALYPASLSLLAAARSS